MTGRDERRAAEALEKLRLEGVLDKGSVEYLKMDLSSIRDAKRAAKVIIRQETKLDVLRTWSSPFHNPCISNLHSQ